MTLAELRSLAEADAASKDHLRRTAGRYAKRAIEKMAAKDWKEATVSLAYAITMRPDVYWDAFLVVSR